MPIPCEHWGVYLRLPGEEDERVIASYQEETATWLIARCVRSALYFAGRTDIDVIRRQHAPQTDASGTSYRNRGECLHHGLKP